MGNQERDHQNEIDICREQAEKFSLCNDYAFKIVFGSEENKDILAAFLEVVTKMKKADFLELRIENPTLMPEYKEKKLGIVDLKIILKDGQKVNIEIQNFWSASFSKRSLYYWSKMYAEDFLSGEDYQKLNKCISINLIRDRFPLSTKTHSVYQVLERDTYTKLDDSLELHFLDLSKAKADDGLGELKKWLVFIQTEERKERMAMAQGNAMLEKANDVMDRFYLDPEARKQYEAAMKIESDYRMFENEFKRRGMEEGIAQGINQANYAMAQKLKAKGFSVSEIEELTGLKPEQI